MGSPSKKILKIGQGLVKFDMLFRNFKKGNKNNQIGVPYTLLSLKNVHDFSVIEMGTSESGEIAILNNQVKPDIAAITNHMDLDFKRE